MAVGEFCWPEVKAIQGIRLAGVEAGVRYANRKDLALIEICEGAAVSGVFTRNAFCAEPVKICREHLGKESARYLVINSGNANACTGDAGYQAAIECCQAVASAGGVSVSSVLPFSTGVIGEVLPTKPIINAVSSAFSALDTGTWLDVAQAIMTTDTRPKGLSHSLIIDGKEVTISGVAKGAGMIKPNMGTMLAYIATDANISQAVLDEVVLDIADSSFNRITIDGDTSTNDAMILMATGAAGNAVIDSVSSETAAAIKAAFVKVCQSLAIEMVRDAEGATKCVEVVVNGGKASKESLDVAYAICHSPLVKTACFASDPNWGRIVAAIGYAGIDDLDVSGVNVWLDDVLIVEQGQRASSYLEEAGQKVFDQAEFVIRVDLGRGEMSERLWTSDLSHEYVKINAEYRS